MEKVGEADVSVCGLENRTSYPNGSGDAGSVGPGYSVGNGVSLN